jgi:hypothetical protein
MIILEESVDCFLYPLFFMSFVVSMSKAFFPEYAVKAFYVRLLILLVWPCCSYAWYMLFDTLTPVHVCFLGSVYGRFFFYAVFCIWVKCLGG